MSEATSLLPVTTLADRGLPPSVAAVGSLASRQAGLAPFGTGGVELRLSFACHRPCSDTGMTPGAGLRLARPITVALLVRAMNG